MFTFCNYQPEPSFSVESHEWDTMGFDIAIGGGSSN